MNEESPKIRPEDLREGIVSQKEIEKIGMVYYWFYKWKSYRTGLIQQFQGYDFDSMLITSRRLFWNATNTDSADLRNLGLDFSIPFARKETMDFLGRLTSLNIKPRIIGDELDSLGVKVINGLYQKWRFHSNDKVEKFYEMLYGLVNGTVCSYVGFDNTEYVRRYLKSHDVETGDFKITEKKQTPWNDVSKEIVPLEDIYLPKIYERNFQKQGRMIWKTQMDEKDFHAQFDQKYKNAKYVVSGNRIAEDSLYYRLLGGSGTTSYNKVELIRMYDWINDEYILTASGMLLNNLGPESNPTISPMPFDHKMGPFTWGITSPIDEKIAYGLPTPFLIKDPHRILNTAYTMAVEREFRAVDPVILSSDIESPEFIFGQHKVLNVNDVNAYKEFQIKEPSNQYFAMMNSLQQQMSSTAQGGDANIVPSRQPESARAVMEDSQEKQQSMANAVIMYYELIRQEVLLVLKTMFQFYTLDKYENADKRIFRQITVPDSPLTLGGTGDLQIRIVKEKKTDVELLLEGIQQSALNGHSVEIVEVPIEFIQGIDFQITEIELVPDNSDDIELANWVENVFNPMVNVYVPAGVASLSKTFLRHMEKMKENPADFAQDQSQQPGQGQPAQPGAPVPTGSANVGQTTGALAQATKGMNQSGPLGTKFGASGAKPLALKK